VLAEILEQHKAQLQEARAAASRRTTDQTYCFAGIVRHQAEVDALTVEAERVRRLFTLVRAREREFASLPADMCTADLDRLIAQLYVSN